MAYNYEAEKENLFTEEGINILLMVRDAAERLLSVSGAFTRAKVIEHISGDSWLILAALDYLKMRGELLSVYGETPGKIEVYTFGNNKAS